VVPTQTFGLLAVLPAVISISVYSRAEMSAPRHTQMPNIVYIAHNRVDLRRTA